MEQLPPPPAPRIELVEGARALTNCRPPAGSATALPPSLLRGFSSANRDHDDDEEKVCSRLVPSVRSS